MSRKSILMGGLRLILMSMLIATSLMIPQELNGKAVKTSTDSPHQIWKTQVVDSPKNGCGYVSMALDSNGNPHISYVDFSDASHNYLKYASWTDTGWKIETIASIGGRGRDCDLALDSKNNPHISYRDTSDGNNLKYASWTGSQWSIETVVSGGILDSLSLVLDSDDNPHISYSNNKDFSLDYASKIESTWSFQTVESQVDVWWHQSLALDSGGNPHIVYLDNWDNMMIKYASWTGSKWYIFNVTSEARYPSLALDSNDKPHITYVSNGGLEYALPTSSPIIAGATWNYSVIDNYLTAFYGSYASLVLDSLGKPYVSYYSIMHGSLNYATYNGSNWLIQIVDSQNERIGEYSSLVLDANGNPHIAYSDNGNGKLKYAIIANAEESHLQTSLSEQLLIAIIAVSAIVASIFLLVYFKKRKH